MDRIIEFIREKIEKEMKRQNIKQSDLAKKINESRSWLNQQLKRNKSFELLDLIKITDGLGITVDSVLPEEKRNNPGISFEEHLRLIIQDELKSK